MTKEKRYIIGGDHHFGREDITAVELFKQAAGMDFDEVWLNGDFLDFSGPSRWSAGTVNEVLQRAELETPIAAKYMKELRDTAPNAKINYLSGNHMLMLGYEQKVLTPFGPKLLEDVTLEDQILSVDDNGNNIWENPTEIIQWKYDGPKYKLGTKLRGYTYMTDLHRVVARKPDGSWVEAKANEKLPATAKLVLAGINGNKDYSISDNEILLSVWMLTDSHRTQNGSWIFYQSGEKSYRIRNLLTALDIEYKERARNRNITQINGKVLLKPPQTQYEFHVSKEWSAKFDWLIPSEKDRLPKWAFQLSKRQVDLFVEEYAFTDGTWSKKGSAEQFNVCKDNLRHDLIQLLAMNSYGATELEYRPERHHWRINISDINTVTGALVNEQKEILEDDINEGWCVRVPSGRFFVMNSRGVQLTGNCERIYKYVEEHAPAMVGLVGLDTVLPIEECKVNLYRYGQGPIHMACGVYCYHGECVASHSGESARKEYEKWDVSTITNHTHRQGVYKRTTMRQATENYETGHLSDVLKQDYITGDTPNWQLGFATAVEWRDNLHIDLVPIKVTEDSYVAYVTGQRLEVPRLDI